MLPSGLFGSQGSPRIATADECLIPLIEKSAIGKDGWILRGSPDPPGLLTAEALEPRRLFTLRADQRVGGRAASLRYIEKGNWQVTPTMRGSLERISLGDSQDWQIGDRALLM